MSTENNGLIAEFMGMNYGDPNDNSVMIQMTPRGNEVVPIDSMKYHCSWDWLMPVVEKIENFGFEFIIAESRCKIKHNTDHSIEELFHIETIGSKINTTYDAVVQFIKNTEYKSCDRCCYDIVDDDGDIMEHICIDDDFY